MPAPLPSTLVLNRAFDDFDELADLARAWQIDFQQLEPGAFRGHLRQIIDRRVHLVWARFGRRLQQRGAPPAGLRSFAIPADPALRLFWRGRWVSGDQILVFPPGGELDAVSLPGFDMIVFSVPEALLEAAARALDIARSAYLPDGVEVMTCAPRAMQSLREQMARVTRRFVGTVPRAGAADASFVLENDSPRQLVIALASGRPDHRRPPARVRDAALVRALAYLRGLDRKPVTVDDLCHVTQVSERTLQYAFLERFGVSPKSYLRSCRLNGVHKELRRADPTGTRVADVAARWGFEHLSRFAVDYRRLFGRRPSETLKRSVP